MTEVEFIRWQAYDMETPIDDVSVHHLPIAFAAASEHSTREHPLTAQDFMPWLPLGDFDEDEVGNVEVMAAQLQSIAEAQNESLK